MGISATCHAMTTSEFTELWQKHLEILEDICQEIKGQTAELQKLNEEVTKLHSRVTKLHDDVDRIRRK